MQLRPRSKNNHYSQRFSGLMELYENNYILLRRLLPQLCQYPDKAHYVSRVTVCLDLHFWVLERSRHTTTIRLSYLFNSQCENTPHRQLLEPDLSVRIYHDAQTAETLSAIVNGKPRARRNASTLQWRWSLNSFLYRWLRYYLHQGHEFTAFVPKTCHCQNPAD